MAKISTIIQRLSHTFSKEMDSPKTEKIPQKMSAKIDKTRTGKNIYSDKDIMTGVPTKRTTKPQNIEPSTNK